jgi:glucan phosphoethanolaminetransferase (alkaline phosphatase superfamily)
MSRMPIYLQVYNYLRHDKSLSILLGTLLLTVFFFFPLASFDPWLVKLLIVFIGLNFTAGVYSVTRSPFYRIAGIVLTVLFLIIGLTTVEYRFHNGNILALILVIIFFSLLAFIILVRIFSEGTVNFHRIQGAIAVFILLGMVFSYIYMLIYAFDKNAFQFSDRLAAGIEHTDYEFLYFSFVTLCTTGYGDITPVSQIAQSVSVMEGIAGVLFPAILIARLISLPPSQRRSL